MKAGERREESTKVPIVTNHSGSISKLHLLLQAASIRVHLFHYGIE